MFLYFSLNVASGNEFKNKYAGKTYGVVFVLFLSLLIPSCKALIKKGVFNIDVVCKASTFPVLAW